MYEARNLFVSVCNDTFMYGAGDFIMIQSRILADAVG